MDFKRQEVQATLILLNMSSILDDCGVDGDEVSFEVGSKRRCRRDEASNPRVSGQIIPD
jgi:hypothetical protein